MFYQEKLTKFLKIYTQLPKNVNALRRHFETVPMTFKGVKAAFNNITYESNMPFALRFMIDNDIKGMSWIQVGKGNYKLRDSKLKKSSCQFEFDVADFKHIESVPFEVESKIAPLRIMSFDIECAAEKGSFPIAQKDPIIQIANIVKEHGGSEPFVRNVFTLKKCA